MIRASILALACTLSAVETKPVPVLRVIDGDTIEVQADLGGQPYPVRVRLLYVDTPESKDNDHGKAMPEGLAAKDALSKFLSNDRVLLSAPGDSFECDGYGRVLAIVYPVALRDGIETQSEWSAQETLIIEGWSPYWQKYGKAPSTPTDWHSALLRDQTRAEREERGAWSTARQWMRNKANERTAPKKEKP